MHGPMKKLIEASYLTADNAGEYRGILRYFYLQHTRMRDYISPEEVLEYLRSFPHYANYEEGQLLTQLAQLVKWGNLNARQDMTKANTIEEYKKKRFRYQPTPYTIEIERMVTELERKSGQSFGGSLEPSQFDRLLKNLYMLAEELTGNLPNTTESYMRLWEDILQAFQTIRTNTADYIAYINNEQTDLLMQSDSFLVYKNQFTTYLRDFIVSLQRTALQISDQLDEMPTTSVQPFLDKLLQHRKDIPRLEEVSEKTIQDWREEFSELWLAIRSWFIGQDHQSSELEMLQIQTNEMIRRITRYVQRMSERYNSLQSRKKDYLHLARMFDQSESIEEAHRLSAVIFGSMTIRHLQVEGDTTDNMHIDTWDEEPERLRINPRVRDYREKTKPGAMVSNKEKKEKLMQEHLLQLNEEKEILNTLFDESNQLTISELGLVQPFVRKTLLRWIGKAHADKEKLVRTDYGFALTVHVHRNQPTILRSEDGLMKMPNVTFVREGGVASGKSR